MYKLIIEKYASELVHFSLYKAYCVKHFIRCLLPIVISICFVISPVSRAEQGYKIGLSVWSDYPESIRGFKQGLAANGLVEGENLTFIKGEVGADKALQKRVAEGFKEAQVDLVYSLTTPGTTIVSNTMPVETPIVFSIVTYPADSGLIESFDYSGNNLVGTSNYVPLRHYVDLLKLILPTARSAAIFHRKGEPNSKIQSANLIRLLKRAGIKVRDREPSNVEQVREMAHALVGTTDVFISTTDTLMQSGGEQALIDISLENSIPILSSNKAGIEKGSSFGPVADFYTLGHISGAMAAQILKKKIKPALLQSKLQDPPLMLANRKSIQQLGIEPSQDAMKVLRWID